ncbi:MAG: hypothetical protein H6701_01320 [Myxococcales bacterium]|nr:hypothetical protein [Myxococcales bacterium]
MDNRRERELVLAPNEYAYVLDTTKGHINCYVGPNKTSLAQTDQPVVFNPASKRFEPADLKEAVSLFATAPANWYVALKNPARDGVHPNRGVASIAPELQVGLKHNVPGPIAFALWPGQMARVIEGHRLRADEYLNVRVYDAAAANAAGWPALGLPVDHAEERPRFIVGEVHIIRGTDARFYLPPTGIDVVPDEEGRHIRTAVRLERLEYCVLVGEDGRQRYIRGEAVVFPRPDQRFLVRDGRRRFRAIELSETTGLHVKVTAPYTEADGTARREGEELFITGGGVIYFPREEHAIIRCGEHELHQAVAIPRGEGRYLLDRHTGEVSLVRGPKMLLPDPRREVIIRRVLSDRECAVMYPGNAEALVFNRALRDGGAPRLEVAPDLPRVKRPVEGPRRRDGAEGFERPASFTPPRTITLDTRFEGAVRVEVWAGFAVQVVDKSGARRVERGPCSLLLAHDELLHPLSLSTGTPKRDAERLVTGYLQVAGNKVSDRLRLVSRDLVAAELAVTYRVDFEGDPGDWFAVDDYVKLLCDHAGSMIKARARQLDIHTLQGEITAVVRDRVLGARPESGERPGLVFGENGMRVHEVEVLDFAVVDEDVRALLDGARVGAMERGLEASAREAELVAQRRLEEVERALARAKHETATLTAALDAERAAQVHAEAEAARRRQAALVALDAEREAAALAAALERQARQAEAEHAEHGRSHARRVEAQALELEALAARVEGAVRAAQAFDPHLVTALNRLGDQALLENLAANFGELAAAEGRGLLATARKFLDFVPASLVPRLAEETAG